MKKVMGLIKIDDEYHMWRKKKFPPWRRKEFLIYGCLSFSSSTKTISQIINVSWLNSIYPFFFSRLSMLKHLGYILNNNPWTVPKPFFFFFLFLSEATKVRYQVFFCFVLFVFWLRIRWSTLTLGPTLIHAFGTVRSISFKIERLMYDPSFMGYELSVSCLS